jgi:hypothetical protein
MTKLEAAAKQYAEKGNERYPMLEVAERQAFEAGARYAVKEALALQIDEENEAGELMEVVEVCDIEAILTEEA